MSITWKDECQCGHYRNYHLEVGIGVCTYDLTSMNPCPCRMFRSYATTDEFKENVGDLAESSKNSGGEEA